MDARRITERRAASAARQLLYHRERIQWMAERIKRNTAALETYLTTQDKQADVLPGGYAVGLADDGEVVVSGPQAGPCYEQLELLETFEGSEVI